jgi:long-chain acyl-CoA synthetase
MPSFYDRLADAGRRFADRPAVEWVGGSDTRTTTYGELLTEASRVARWLEESAAIVPGDRVAILAANDERWVASFIGVLQIGAVAVPLDTGYSAGQVRAVVADSGARLVIAGDRYLDRAEEARRSSAQPFAIVPLAGGPLAELSSASAVEPVPTDADAAAVILYTSGTTADPKGVVLTHANLEAERAAVLAIVQADERDVVLGVLPLFHALAEMANLWLPLTIGARVVFLETVSSTTLLAALETRGITILACVPQFFYLIHQRVAGEIGRRGWLARRLFRLIVDANVVLRDRFGWNPGRRIFRRVHHALGPHMRLLITGGSRFDPAIARDLYGLGVSLYNGYGLTETSGAATIVRPGDRFTTSVGQPIPGVEVRIDASRPERGGPGVEDDDEPADGEVLIRGPVVMREYFRRPDATSEAVRDGWLHTGDLGRLDADGRLYITGRKKEIIVLASGKNIYPEEIEAHYRQSPFVKELCVLGMSRAGDPSSERLHAVIVPDEQVLRERGVVNLRELMRFEIEGLSVALPAHKRILSYDISMEPLARTTTGKLKRPAIERLARARIDAPATARPVSEDERGWLAVGARAADAAAIARHLGRSEVAPDANLELDLGLDSMERVELVTMVEARHGRRVAADARARIFTVRQLVEAVERAEASAAPAPAEALPWEAVLGEPPDPALVTNLSRPKLVRALVIWTALRGALVVSRIVLGLGTSGQSRIPRRGPLIVSPNHQTYLDGFIVAAALPFHAFRRIFFVGAAEYFETPFMRWGARAINIVPVDPDANLVSAMRAAATGLRLGKVLMLFPEGERSIDGAVKPFRKGAAILGAHLDVPVVPVALDGLFPLWPRGRSFQWRVLFTRQTRGAFIEFGDPMTMPARDYAGGAAALQARVLEMLAPLRKTS